MIKSTEKFLNHLTDIKEFCIKLAEREDLDLDEFADEIVFKILLYLDGESELNDFRKILLTEQFSEEPEFNKNVLLSELYFDVLLSKFQEGRKR